MNESATNTVVKAVYGGGPDKCLAHVVAYRDHPSFELETVEGHHFTWAAHLCREASPEEQVEYWKERALAAEAKNESE